MAVGALTLLKHAFSYPKMEIEGTIGAQEVSHEEWSDLWEAEVPGVFYALSTIGNAPGTFLACRRTSSSRKRNSCRSFYRSS